MSDQVTSEAPDFNPYRVLSLPMNARTAEIEDAYNRLFDRYESAAESGEEDAVQKLDDLNHAFDVLSDSEQRRALDARLGKTGSTSGTRTQSFYATSSSAMAPSRSSAIEALKILGWAMMGMSVLVGIALLALGGSSISGSLNWVILLYVAFIIVAGVASGTFFLVVANIAENVAAMRQQQEESH